MIVYQHTQLAAQLLRSYALIEQRRADGAADRPPAAMQLLFARVWSCFLEVHLNVQPRTREYGVDYFSKRCGTKFQAAPARQEQRGSMALRLAK
jgi:hypothetical protein